MATSLPRQRTSPLVKAALAAVALTGGLGIFLIARQLSPKPRVVAAPPPLETEGPLALPEAPPRPPAPTPVEAPPPEPPAPPPQARAPSPVETPVNALPRNALTRALFDAQDPARKLEILRRWEREGGREAIYAVVAMFTDADKAVRLEAIRIAERLDTQNETLMAKVRAVNLYEKDPDVKAEYDRLIQHYRRLEEAAARQAQALAEPQP